MLPLKDFVTNEPQYYENYTISRKADTLRISLDGAEKGDYLFLPLYHDSGWKCTVNDYQITIEEFANYFMEIPLQAGKNEIILSFIPKGLILGIIISFMGILLLIVACKCLMRQDWKTANCVFFILGETIFVILTMMFYIIPILFFIKKLMAVVLG